MTLAAISFRMARGSLGRHWVLVGTGAFVASIIYLFADLLTSPRLMTAAHVNAFVLYAPSLVLLPFGSFLLAYANASFGRLRMRELGILSTVGAGDASIARIILAENALMSALSLAAGCVFGGIGSAALRLLVRAITRVPLGFLESGLNPLLFTAAFIAGMYALTTAATLLGTLSRTAADLLKGHRLRPRPQPHPRAAAVVGLALLTLALACGPALLRGLGVNALALILVMFFAGIFLCATGISGLVERASVEKPADTLIRVHVRTSLSRSIREARGFVVVGALLAAVSVFFAGLGSMLVGDAERLARGMYPFDLAYTIVGGGADEARREVAAALADSPLRGLRTATIPYLNANGLVLVPAAGLRVATGFDCPVPSGRFVTLFQVMMDSNYPMDPLDDMDLASVTIGGRTLTRSDRLVRVLFNDMEFLTRGFPRYLIVSDADFTALAGARAGYAGHLDLVSLGGPGQERDALDRVSTVLKGFGALVVNWPEEGGAPDGGDAETFSLVSSRAVHYRAVMAQDALTIWLFAFVGLVFFILLPASAYFKLLNDLERGIREARTLHLVGMGMRRIAALVWAEVGILLVVPFILGTGAGLFVSHVLPRVVGDGGLAARVAAGTTTLYAAALLAASILIGRAYQKKLFSGMMGRA
jgi:putative ABC transport system permease protein